MVMEAPTVGLDFTYYPTDGFNERALGFYVRLGRLKQGFASGHLLKVLVKTSTLPLLLKVQMLLASMEIMYDAVIGIRKRIPY
jgi:hypothetical protein